MMFNPMGFGRMAPGLRPRMMAAPAMVPQMPRADTAPSVVLDPWNTDRGEASKDAVHGKSFDQMNNQELMGYADRRANGNIVERNLSSLAGFAAPMGLGLGLSQLFGGLEKSQLAAELGNRGLSNPADFVGGQIAGAANTGMNVAGGVQNPELMGRNDISQGGPPGGFSGGGVNAAELGADPNAPGMFAQGGVVRKGDLRGPNPPGRDEGFVGVHAGELILNQAQQNALARALMGRRRR